MSSTQIHPNPETGANPVTEPAAHTASMPVAHKLERHEFLLLAIMVIAAFVLILNETLLGVALFFFDQLKPGYILGNCVAIVAGMFMAGMFVTVGEMQGEERFSAIFIGQMLTFLVGLPFVIATKPELTAQTLGCILALGVFQLGISYILYVKASVYCTPLACCLLGAVEPLLNPVWVFLFDGERPGLFALIGSVIVIVSVTLWCIFGKEKAAAGEEHA